MISKREYEILIAIKEKHLLSSEIKSNELYILVKDKLIYLDKNSKYSVTTIGERVIEEFERQTIADKQQRASNIKSTCALIISAVTTLIALLALFL